MPDLEPIKAVPPVRVAKLEPVGPIRSDAEPAIPAGSVPLRRR